MGWDHGRPKTRVPILEDSDRKSSGPFLVLELFLPEQTLESWAERGSLIFPGEEGTSAVFISSEPAIAVYSIAVILVRGEKRVILPSLPFLRYIVCVIIIPSSLFRSKDCHSNFLTNQVTLPCHFSDLL